MKHYYLTFLLLFSSLIGFSQYDSHQSFQTHEMGMINPAWYSRDNSISIHASGMLVLSSFTGTPTAYAIGGAIPIKGINSSVGLNMNHYKLGPQSKKSVSSFFAHSYMLSSKNHILSAYLSVGFDRYVLDGPMLNPGDVASLGKIHHTETVLGFGAMFFSPEKYFIGFSMPNFSLNELGLKSKKTKPAYGSNYYLMGGYLGKINESLKIKPIATVVLYEQNINRVFNSNNNLPESKLHSNIDISTVLYIHDTYGMGITYNIEPNSKASTHFRNTKQRIGAYSSYHANDNLKLSLAWSSYVGSKEPTWAKNDLKLGVSYHFGKEISRKFL